MLERYKEYHLKNNPFPESPTIIPSSSDIRVNGTIFNEEIFKEEIGDLRKKIERKTNLIYALGAFSEKGTGKSALITSNWKELSNEPLMTSIYIRVAPKSNPKEICVKIIDQWHEKGFLWEALKNCLKSYVRSEPSPKLSPEAVEVFLEKYTEMVDSIDLSLFTFYDPGKLISDLSRWAHQQSETVNPDRIRIFFENYLSHPRAFINEYRKSIRREYDEIDFFKTVLEFMKISNFDYHFFFLDQFEEAVFGTTPRELSNFCADMRRFLEVCINRATVVVTLHPGAHRALGTSEGSHLTSIAPLDERHIVYIEQLSSEDAIKLCSTYIVHFKFYTYPKLEDTYPFDKDAIKYICYLKNGNPRDILMALHEAIEEGADAGHPFINLDFIKNKHRPITGKVFDQKKFDEFRMQLGAS